MQERDEYERFNAVSGLSGRNIILFGAGRMAIHYLVKYGKNYPPVFIIDNNSDKWGSQVMGIEVRSPDILGCLALEKYRIIIAVKAFRPIVRQLEGIGIMADGYRIFNVDLDSLLCGKMDNTISEGKYNIGYVTGVFDLFHIGHLNLLKNCKTRCHYLVAGVLTDELTERDKHKKPFIPFEERKEIICQCKYVDRVITVDFHNADKIDAWKELRYGCLFSGSDHDGEPSWIWLQEQLRTLGAELEYFPYTKSTSSSMLQKIIQERIGESVTASPKY